MDDDEFNVESLSKHRAQKAEEDKRAALAAAKNDPDLEAILMESKQVQKDTLVSTQNSVRVIKETVVVADKTTVKLKQQGEQLDRVEGSAEQADLNAQDSYQSARELHKYKGFLPVSLKNMVTGSKKKQQDAELDKINKKLDKQTAKQEKNASLHPAGGETNRRNSPAPGPRTEYADETEKQIDQDLDEISAGLDHLKASGMEMQSELSRQDVTVTRIGATTEHTDYALNSANRKIKEFL